MGPNLLSPMHLIVLAVLGLLLFGPKRLPEIGRSLGTGLREFKTTLGGMDGVTGAARTLNDTRTAATPRGIAQAVIPGITETPNRAATPPATDQTTTSHAES